MSNPKYPAIAACLKPRRRGRALVALLQFGCLLGGVVSLLGLAGAWSWVFDIGSHFQAQYAGFQLLCGLVFLVLKRFRWAAVAAVFLAIPTIQLAPYYLVKPVPTALAMPIRVVSFNVRSSNTHYAETLAWVRETAPDVAFFPEVNPKWAAALEPLKASLPYALAQPQNDHFGWAFFSKHPILEHEFYTSQLVEVPVVRVVLAIAGRRVVFFGVHPLPPMSPACAANRDSAILQLAAQVRQETGPVIVGGDLNATPWSRSMQPLFAAGLHDTQLGRGFSATWRRNIPIFAIPIDHLLLAGPIAATARWTGPDLGSDHHPIVADLRF